MTEKYQNVKDPVVALSFLRHSLSLALLLLVDLHQKLRRIISRTFLRLTLVVLSLSLLVLVFSSLVALRHVTRSIESLISDSMVGLESSISMRTAVRETQLDLLRLQLNPGRRLPRAEVDAFNHRLRDLLMRYQMGIFETEDKANVQRIELRLANYLDSLQPMVDVPQAELAAVRVADDAARDLVEAVEQAYQYNRQRIHLSAGEAGNAARQALQISNRLWWGFAIFAIFVLLIYVAYRWLAVPESQDG